jgi:hypothetical protein
MMTTDTLSARASLSRFTSGGGSADEQEDGGDDIDELPAGVVLVVCPEDCVAAEIPATGEIIRFCESCGSRMRVDRDPRAIEEAW